MILKPTACLCSYFLSQNFHMLRSDWLVRTSKKMTLITNHHLHNDHNVNFCFLLYANSRHRYVLDFGEMILCEVFKAFCFREFEFV